MFWQFQVLTWQELRELCSKYGTVLRAEIILDRITGTSKGFGTVRFETTSQAQNAIGQLNNPISLMRTYIHSIH